MLMTLLLVVLAASPCSPSETTAVCQCKQGVASACEALRQTDPKLAAKLEQEAAQRAQQASKPVVLTGQQHHVISKRIADVLSKHDTLKGLYQARDPRFVTQAVDKAAHNGYQHWHRQVDEEVVTWLWNNRTATPAQFEAFLRSIYSRPEMLARFPNGF
ncbi:Wall-associated protein precursor [Pyxidicoccus fallax]|uniref:Wall-associated protein n=1 Tax=Pyxidicoccus fallax TaxID=394095 RepID=A0A848LAZ0_9BACT|nr:Wall-associated protein precursor [Pyxidicoccus fallax]NMO15797.1 Wall-associated protein precursor [Pyxidicoccus fallax]NPC82645.1 Wall-associated protein precursor [Pyxidicoccus fallax]